jgi:hypothetical protein
MELYRAVNSLEVERQTRSHRRPAHQLPVLLFLALTIGRSLMQPHVTGGP